MRRCARPDAGGLHALLRQRQVRDAPISSGLFSDDRAQHMAEPIAPAKAARDYLSARRRMRCSHPARAGAAVRGKRIATRERKSVGWGKSVSVRVDLGGRRNIKKKNTIHTRQKP